MLNTSIDRRSMLQGTALLTAVAALGPATAQAADNNLVIIAELVSKPERADDLRNLLVPFVEGARKEPGCEHYTLLEDRKRPGRFLTYEIWTDEAALAAHMQTPAIKAAGPKLATILAAPFTQAFLSVLSTN